MIATFILLFASSVYAEREHPYSPASQNHISPLSETLNEYEINPRLEETQNDNEEITWNPSVPRRVQRGKTSQCGPTAEQKAAAKERRLLKTLKSHIQVGGSYTYAHITPNHHASTSGHLGGMQALYEYKAVQSIYEGIAVSWKQGNTHGSSGSRFLLCFDAQERIGYTWGSWKKGRMLTFFTGLGYRYNGNHVKVSGNSVSFDYSELYAPVGFLIRGRLSSIVSAGLNFQWMPQVYPTLKITPLKGARWILNNKISNFRGELPLTICLAKKHRVSLMLVPFFEHWQDGHTSAKTQLGTVLHVPGNRYLMGGIDLNFRWSF